MPGGLVGYCRVCGITDTFGLDLDYLITFLVFFGDPVVLIYHFLRVIFPIKNCGARRWNGALGKTAKKDSCQRKA